MQPPLLVWLPVVMFDFCGLRVRVRDVFAVQQDVSWASDEPNDAGSTLNYEDGDQNQAWFRCLDARIGDAWYDQYSCKAVCQFPFGKFTVKCDFSNWRQILAFVSGQTDKQAQLHSTQVILVVIW